MEGYVVIILTLVSVGCLVVVERALKISITVYVIFAMFLLSALVFSPSSVWHAYICMQKGIVFMKREGGRERE